VRQGTGRYRRQCPVCAHARAPCHISRSKHTDHHCPRTPTVYMRSEKVECPTWSGHTR
jgi:hypothetical protein